MTMLDFNLWSWNSRIFPGIDSLNVRLNDKVRIRLKPARVRARTSSGRHAGLASGWCTDTSRTTLPTTSIKVRQTHLEIAGPAAEDGVYQRN